MPYNQPGGTHNSGYGSASNSGGGRSNGAADAGRAAAQMTQAEQDRLIHWAPDPSAPPSSGPAPTFQRNVPFQGPRPGTGDRWGTSVGQDPAIQKQQDLYNQAADSMANRGFGGWAGDTALDLIPGFHQVTPAWNQPSTYANGTYHDAWSPVAAALGVAGMASPIPGTSLAAGKIGQLATDKLGLPDYRFGGGGWHPDESNPIEKAFGPTTDPYGQGSGNPGKTPNLGNPTQGGQQPQIAGPGTGIKIFNPMPAPTQPGTPTQPAIFPQQPPIQSLYNVPGGLPYGINLFRRAA